MSDTMKSSNISATGALANKNYRKWVRSSLIEFAIEIVIGVSLAFFATSVLL